MQSLLLLFGVWLVLQNLAYAIWGGDTQSILTPYTMESVPFLGGRFGVPQILVFGVSILSLVGLNLVLRRTYLGKAIRAVTQNRDAAMLSGVNAGQIAAVAFGIGTAFAAMAGSMLSTLYAFTPDFGRSFLLKAFCIIVLGGMESFTGVAVGALVLAFIENFASAYTSIPVSYQDAISFTLLVVVLVAAPGGLPGPLADARPASGGAMMAVLRRHPALVPGLLFAGFLLLAPTFRRAWDAERPVEHGVLRGARRRPGTSSAGSPGRCRSGTRRSWASARTPRCSWPKPGGRRG